MTGIIKYKTIQSDDKKDFEELIFKHLKQGWTLIDKGYSYDDGLHTREIVYIENKNEYVTFYENNMLLRRCKIDSEGQWHGEVVEYHESGNIESKRNYVHGSCDGKYKYWYDNGCKAVEGNWKDDNKIGKWKYWYDNGNLKLEEELGSSWFPVGKYKVYYPNGDPMLSGEWEEDYEKVAIPSPYSYEYSGAKRHAFCRRGIWEFWDKDGNYYSGVPTPSAYHEEIKKEYDKPDYELLFFNHDRYGSKFFAKHYDIILPHSYSVNKTRKLPYTETDIIYNTDFFDNGKIAARIPKKVWWYDPSQKKEYEYEACGNEIKYYYENGKTKESLNWIFNENYIPLMNRDEWGRKLHLKKNCVDGEYIKNYINGQTCIIGNYEKNYPVGEWLKYYPNGRLQSRYNVKFSYEEDKIDVELFSYDGVKNYVGSISEKIFEENDGKEGLKIDLKTEKCGINIYEWQRYTSKILYRYIQSGFYRGSRQLNISFKCLDELNEYLSKSSIDEDDESQIKYISEHDEELDNVPLSSMYRWFPYPKEKT
jgi:antitoxin component YwqK of YwqJK toxin-antitoxin module